MFLRKVKKAEPGVTVLWKKSHPVLTWIYVTGIQSNLFSVASDGIKNHCEIFNILVPLKISLRQDIRTTFCWRVRRTQRQSEVLRP